MRPALRKAASWTLLLCLLLLQAHLVLHALGRDDDEAEHKQGQPPEACQLCAVTFAPKLAEAVVLPCLAPVGLPFTVLVPDHYQTVAFVPQSQPLLRGPPAFLSV